MQNVPVFHELAALQKCHFLTKMLHRDDDLPRAPAVRPYFIVSLYNRLVIIWIAGMAGRVAHASLAGIALVFDPRGLIWQISNQAPSIYWQQKLNQAM